MILGKKATHGSTMFKKVSNNAPNLFRKVSTISDIVKRGAGALSLIAPEFAPVLTTIGGIAEGIQTGSNIAKGYLEKNKAKKLKM
jgi:hypothetical protein